MKNRKREICTSGSVRDEDGNILIYSANDRGDRGNVGIIRPRLDPTRPKATLVSDLCKSIFSAHRLNLDSGISAQ